VAGVETKSFFTVGNAVSGSRHVTASKTNMIIQFECQGHYFTENGRHDDHSPPSCIGHEIHHIHPPLIIEAHILHLCYEFSDVDRILNALPKQSFVLTRTARQQPIHENVRNAEFFIFPKGPVCWQ
jgi:hypothetical protein